MDFLQELFLTACMAVVFSVIVAASIAFSGGNEKACSVIKIEEKSLNVVGAKSKKKVTFMDDVVVGDVEEELSNDLKFLETFDGILEKSLEEEISRDEVNIVKMFESNALDYEGVDEEAEVIIAPSRKIVEEIGNVNLADVEEKDCKGFPVIDEVLEKAIAEIPESNHFKGNSQSQVGSGSEMRYAVEEIKREEIDSITGLNMVDDDDGDDDDVSTNQKGVEEGGKDCISGVLLGETLKKVAVEERNQCTDIDINTDKGIKETEISAFDGVLENLSVGESTRNQALGGCGSEVDRLSDSPLPENEEDGALCEESNVVAMKEDLGKSCTVIYGEFEKDDDGDDDDDWEGIERSELEKVFAKAVNYVEYGGKDKNDQLSNMGSNVQIQLYGLHKLAVEGPCYEPQPMALKVSARAKWNSWQKLGSISPELAMEQYIKLLSETDPKWAYHPDAGDGKGGLIPSGSDVGLDTILTMLKELKADDEEGGRSEDI